MNPAEEHKANLQSWAMAATSWMCVLAIFATPAWLMWCRFDGGPTPDNSLSIAGALALDDGSADDTWQALETLPVFSLRHPINLGQGAAIQTGMTFAIQKGADFVVHFDADGQHSHEQIEKLLEPLLGGQADIVLGSRFLNVTDTELVPLSKRILLKGATLVNFAFSGLKLTDAHNGFRALSRAAAMKIDLQENRFSHASEILEQIRRHRLRWIEVPSTIHYTDYSQAKGQPISNAINILIDLVARRFLR